MSRIPVGRFVGFLCFAWCGLSAFAPAEDWPCFHGPERDNRSDETGLLKTWPAKGPDLLWTANFLGKGYSSVAVSDGVIYTAGKSDRQTFVYAIDTLGRPRWKAANGAAWKAGALMFWAKNYDGARSTPTVDDGMVYHLGGLGRLAAFDSETGKEQWFVDLRERFDAPLPRYGFCESVLVVDEKLICCPGGAKGYIVALDKKTGKPIWANTDLRDEAGYCSPIVVAYGGGRQVMSMSAKTVFGADLKTGRLRWQVAHGNFRDNNATDPVFHDGRVYASSGYGGGSILVRLGGAGAAMQARRVWKSDLLDNHHGGVVLVDGYLYGAGHHSQGWHCLAFMTGKLQYRAEGKGALTYADGMLYCLDEKGTMSLVKANPARWEVAASFTLPAGGEGLWWAHPVVSNGRLYLRHDNRLFAYDVKE